MMTLLIVSLVVLAVSAVASGTEAAMFSVPLSRARANAKAGRPGWAALLAIKEDMAHAIGTIVIVNNIANIVGSAVVGAVAADVFDSALLGVFFALFTLAIIIFSELLPKTLAEAHADTVAPLAAPVVLFATRTVFHPVLWIINRIVALFRAGEAMKAKVSEDEIKMLALMGHEAGSIEPDESRMIQRVFRLNDITAEDMMTPAPIVESIRGSVTVGEQYDAIVRLRHSRVPVWSEAPDNVLGIVMLDDLLLAIARDRFETKPSELVQEPLFVGANLPADDLLELFRRREKHLAIVLDAERRMIGVVTLEDVLEELVGEITDEKDVRPERARRVSKNEILVDEATDIGHINHFFNTTIPGSGPIGDYVLEKFGRPPKTGDELRDEGLAFIIAKMSRTRPKRITIRKQD